MKIFKIICKSVLTDSTVDEIGKEKVDTVYRLANSAEDAVGSIIAEALEVEEEIIRFEAFSKFDISITKRDKLYLFTNDVEKKKQTRTDSLRITFTVVEDDFCKVWNNA